MLSGTTSFCTSNPASCITSRNNGTPFDGEEREGEMSEGGGEGEGEEGSGDQGQIEGGADIRLCRRKGPHRTRRRV